MGSTDRVSLRKVNAAFEILEAAQGHPTRFRLIFPQPMPLARRLDDCILKERLGPNTVFVVDHRTTDALSALKEIFSAEAGHDFGRDVGEIAIGAEPPPMSRYRAARAFGGMRRLCPTYDHLGPALVLARSTYQAGLTRQTLSPYVLANIHSASLSGLRGTGRDYSAVLVPVSAKSYEDRTGLVNASSSHLSVSLEDYSLAQAGEFFRSAARQRVRALRRLEWYGNLPVEARRAISTISRIANVPRETAVLSIIDKSSLPLPLQERQFFFQAPIRNRDAVSFGVIKGPDDFSICAYGRVLPKLLQDLLVDLFPRVKMEMMGAFTNVE